MRKPVKYKELPTEYHRYAKMGDGLLKIIVTDLVYTKDMPAEERGGIDVLFNSNRFLTTLPIFLKPKGVNLQNSKLYGDFVEASIYWMYKNYGYQHTKAFIGRQIKKYLKENYNGIYM